jgi:tRNA1(Val) A37 N6-methylase TrmN6
MKSKEYYYTEGVNVYISKEHNFGTDAVLLAKFAKARAGQTVCDLCTGCGIVAVLMYRYYKAKKIYAVDISENAINLLNKTIAENPKKRLGFSLEAVCRDLKEFNLQKKTADVVTVNPPYFKKDSGKTRKGEQAAARHEELCDFGDIARTSAGILKFSGMIYLCHRPERLADVIYELRANGIEPKEVVFLSTSYKSSPWLFLMKGKKGGNSGMIVRHVTTRDFIEELKKRK